MSPAELSQLSAIAVAALCGIVIPFLVDLVTKSHAPRGLKAATAAALAAGAGVLSTSNLAAGFHWPTLVIATAAAFVTTMATHSTGASNIVQRATANVGIGGARPA